MPPLLEQTTYINISNLSIVIMGDSVGMQLAGAYQRMATVGHHHHQQPREDWMVQHGYEILTHMPTSTVVSSDNGHVFGWRVSAMFSAANENVPVRNRKRPGGWNQQQIDLITMIMNNTTTHNISNVPGTTPIRQGGRQRQQQSVDAIVFRIPQGWISLRDVNNTSLHETVTLLHEKLHMRVLTFLTLPIVNNYVTRQDFEELQRTNELIQQFVVDWNNNRRRRRRQPNDPYVLILDLGLLMHQAVIANGKHVLMDAKNKRLQSSDAINGISNQYDDIDMLVQHRVKAAGDKTLTSPAALVCGKPPYNATASNKNKNNRHMECDKNVISVDGVHICMETFSGRILAGLSCQHACVFNNNNNHNADDGKMSLWNDKNVLECAQHCNQRYMNLTGPTLQEQQLIRVTMV